MGSDIKNSIAGKLKCCIRMIIQLMIEPNVIRISDHLGKKGNNSSLVRAKESSKDKL